MTTREQLPNRRLSQNFTFELSGLTRGPRCRPARGSRLEIIRWWFAGFLLAPLQQNHDCSRAANAVAASRRRLNHVGRNS
jgi:hypothetical protein